MTCKWFICCVWAFLLWWYIFATYYDVQMILLCPYSSEFSLHLDCDEAVWPLSLLILSLQEDPYMIALWAEDVVGGFLWPPHWPAKDCDEISLNPILFPNILNNSICFENEWIVCLRHIELFRDKAQELPICLIFFVYIFCKSIILHVEGKNSFHIFRQPSMKFCFYKI